MSNLQETLEGEIALTILFYHKGDSSIAKGSFGSATRGFFAGGDSVPGQADNKAIEFTILTACRTSEVLKAKWNEIDFNNKIWIIPEDRMKAHREHHVPLSDRSILILQEIFKIKSDSD